MFYQKTEAELKESYRKMEDANKAVVAAYQKDAALSETRVVLAQQARDIEKQRRKDMSDVLLKILTMLRDHDTTPEGKAHLDSLIEGVRSMDEPNAIPSGGPR